MSENREINGMFEHFQRLEDKKMPYGGEVAEPVTYLDACVADVIARHGNDNDLTQDRYSRPKNGLHPSDHMLDNEGRLLFGVDFLTHRFSLPLCEITCVYSMRHASAEVYIDQFEESQGLVARTVLHGRQSKPAAITKYRREDFSVHYRPSQQGRPLFKRELRKVEREALPGLLLDPLSRIDELAPYLSVSRSERRRANKNEQQLAAADASYHAALEEADRAQSAASARSRDFTVE